MTISKERQKVNNLEQFIRRNFSNRYHSDGIVLNWTEDTDVADDMTPGFKKRLLRMLAKGDY